MTAERSDGSGGLPPPPTESLSDQYHKARRQLVLFSGLLFAWEFIGLTLPPSGELPIIKIGLESPQAIPWVLLLCMLYFGTRLGIEWSLAPEGVRLRAASKIDLSLAGGIATLSATLYFVQAVWEIQVAETFSPWSFLSFLLLFTCAMFGSGLGLVRYDKRRDRAIAVATLLTFIAGWLAAPVILWFYGNPMALLAYCATGVVVSIGGYYISARRHYAMKERIEVFRTEVKRDIDEYATAVMGGDLQTMDRLETSIPNKIRTLGYVNKVAAAELSAEFRRARDPAV